MRVAGRATGRASILHRGRAVLRILLPTLLLAGSAWAQPRQCLGTGETLIILDETFVVSLAPDGFENQLKVARCAPLIQRPGILFDYSAWDVGAFNHLSPIYDLQGVTAAVVPLSFLELRVDAAVIGVWTLPLEGAGYFAVSGYGAAPKRQRPEDARSSWGANVTASARLQAEAPFFHDTFVFTNTFQADWWFMNGGTHFFNPRRDVVLAKSDVLLKNVTNVLFKVQARETVAFQLGAQNDLTFVPASGYVGNILGLFLSVQSRRHAALLRDLEPFVRLGVHTHGHRRGFQLFGGISLAWGWARP